MDEILLRKQSNIALGALISLFSYFCVALMAACVKLVPENINISIIVFFQYVVSFVLCLPFVAYQGFSNLKTDKFSSHLLRALVGILTFGFFFLSLTYISIVKSIVLRSTTPFWIPLILFIWRGQKISRLLWLAILIGFVGIVLIVQPGTSGYLNIGTFYALFSGFIMAISALMIRKMSSTEPGQRSLFYYFLIATLTSLPFAISHWVSISWSTLKLLLIIGFLMYFIQYTLIKAFQYGKTSVLAPISYTAIIFSGILDWLLWSKTPGGYEYIGITLVILSGLAAVMIERKDEK